MSARDHYLLELQRAVEACHDCKASHDSSVTVREVFKDEVAWEGVVEVFHVFGHAKASRCYAWGYPDPKGRPGDIEAVTVLEIPPVTSPQTAVKAAIVSEARRRRG